MIRRDPRSGEVDRLFQIIRARMGQSMQIDIIRLQGGRVEDQFVKLCGVSRNRFAAISTDIINDVANGLGDIFNGAARFGEKVCKVSVKTRYASVKCAGPGYRRFMS